MSANTFVGVGSGNYLWKSTDGTTWTETASVFTSYLYAVAYSPSLGLFVTTSRVSFTLKR